MSYRVRLGSIVVLTALLALGQFSAAGAADSCGFTLGFAALREQLPAVVGECLEPERFNLANGNAEQRTTGGLLVWRKADNWTAFTDGTTTWVNGPYGLQSRPNHEQFSWEAEPSAAPETEQLAAEPLLPSDQSPRISLPDSATAPVPPGRVHAALHGAIGRLVTLPLLGQSYRELVESTGVVITLGPVPRSFVATYNATSNTVTVAEHLLEQDERVVVAVLAHELTHARQVAANPERHHGDQCVEREVEAFVEEARVWDALFDGNPPSRNELERNLTRLVVVYKKEGEAGIRRAIERTDGYRRQCHL